MTMLDPNLQAAILTSQIPEIMWIHGDDECDCTFQRIGEWANPYIGRTLRIRLCCIWAELAKQYPQFVQEIPAYYDGNTGRYVTEPAAWDSETDAMPYTLWYRQLAAQQGISIADVRANYEHRKHERPQAVEKGEGRESRPEPTQMEQDLALYHRLVASGWIIPGEHHAG